MSIDLEFSACDNDACGYHERCRRYTLFTLGAQDVKKGSGTKEKACKRYLEQEKSIPKKRGAQFPAGN